jgi:hypothetical protein
LIATLAAVGEAGVTIERFSRTGLLAGLGTMESSERVGLQADKRVTDSESKIVGGILGLLGGGASKTGQITRLDRDSIWQLDHKAKTYSVQPIRFPSDSEIAGANVQAESKGEKPNWRVRRSELKVEKTGGEKDINGFPCVEYLLTWTMVLEDTVKKDSVVQVMTTREWTTPLTNALKAAKAAEEAFNAKLYKKMGVSVSTEEMQNYGGALLTTTYGLDSRETAQKMAQVNAELAKVSGYPIVTEVQWRVKGDSSEAVEPEEPQPRSGGLSGMLSRKITDAVAPKPQKSGQDLLFSSYSELKSVKLEDLPADRFEVPAGYKPAK